MKYKTYNAVRKFIFRNYFKIYNRLEVLGINNIPDGPALIVPNHSGGFDLDIVCISNFCHPIREIQVLIMDKYHYMNHMWGRYWIGSGIPLWLRGGLRWQYINPYLHKKGSKFPGLVCMFPEGNSGEFRYRNILNKFFPGVVKIALKYEIPIVPTAMIGFHKISPILKSFYQEHGPPDPVFFPFITFPFKIIVEFGRPFELDEFYNRKLTKEEKLWIANRIIRPKIAKLKMKYGKVDLAKVDVKMKRP